MKRIAIAVILGLSLQALVVFGVHGHIGPCGPSDAFGAFLFIVEVPAFWLAQWFHLHGPAENAVYFLTPVPVYTAIAWLCISTVTWFQKWNRSKANKSSPEQRP